MTPTAAEAAAAILAACKETGEKPIDIVSAKIGGRARHYAMHAIIAVFPEIPRKNAARLVFCPGKPGMFYGNSWSQVAKPVGDGRRVAAWWDDAVFERVIEAVLAEQGDREDDEPEGEGGDFLEVRATPKPPIKLSAVDDRRIVEPVRPFASARQRRAAEELAEAMRNTANLPVPD